MERISITLTILKARLDPFYPGVANRSFADHALNSLLFFGSDSTSRNVVYVARAEELRGRLLTGLTLICVGEPDEGVRNAAADILIIPEPADIHALFNRAQSAFLSLYRWDQAMASCAIEEADVNRLMEVARTEFNWSLILLNLHLSPIASDLSPDLFLSGDDTQTLIDLFLADSTMAATDPIPAPMTFRNEQMGITGIYYNILYDNEDFQGKLLAIRNIQQPAGEADIQLFSTVCYHMELTYRHFSASNLRSSTYMLVQHALSSLIHDKELSRSDCIETLKLIGWKVNDRYRLFFFPFYGQDMASNQASFLITLLENRFASSASPGNGTSSSRGLITNEGVVWVLNRSTADNMDIRRVTSELGEMAKGFGAKVGLSSECRDVFSLNLYYRQAQNAIIAGSAVDPDVSIYNFREYSLYHILSHSYEPYDPMDVVHPAVVILMRYDRENGTEYNKTLRTFIACRYNVLKASAQLYIHRSTFTVRIKRIEELADIDLEDERTRLHILLSYYIMESSGMRF